MRIATSLTLLAACGALEDGSAEFYRASFADDSVPANSTASLTLLTDQAEESGARCLDGTPGAYYFREGSGDGARKWYIHQQGGGWCESMKDCFDRSHSALGSSSSYAKLSPLSGGYFDTRPAVNPMMYNWNLVFMPYCDGGSFSGDNETVATYENTSLYFRGKRVRHAVYQALLSSRGIGSATDVVISGCSAGGLATYLHADAWCDDLARDVDADVKCVALPDSGFFLDYEQPGRSHAAGAHPRRLAATSDLGVTVPGRYHAGLRWVFETMNASSGINSDCIAAHGIGDSPAYLCMFAEHSAVFTHTPIFGLQSTYDAWQTTFVLDQPGPTPSVAAVNLLGANITKRMEANLFGPHPRSGAFLDSCWHHCGQWNHIRIDGVLVSEAFAKWYAGLDQPAGSGDKRLWRQGKPFKCDECCTP